MDATPAPVAWSTTAVAQDEAFDYWRDLICDAFVQLSARPVAPGPFTGEIEHRDVGEVALSVVSAGAQQVERTRGLIARSQEEYVLASIQLDGTGQVRQEGRTVELRPGALAFYDSTRPYTLSFDRAFRQLVVQVPRAVLPHRRLHDATAVLLEPRGPGRLVSDFFVGLAREPSVPAALGPHALGLLDFALGLAADTGPALNSSALHERITTTIRRASADPDLDAAAVADRCHISRRTLFRVLADRGETFAQLLRADRVRRARALLIAEPDLPVAAVAARSGFAGPAQLHRTFRAVTGTTPGACRERS